MNADHILSTPPQIHPIDRVAYPEVLSYKASQEIPVYEIRKAGCDVISVEATFLAGRPQEITRLASACTAGVIREGAGKYDADTLSEEVDFYGATLSVMASMDYITIRTVCLKKYFDPMMDIMAAVIADPHFKEEELTLFVKKRIERLNTEMAKNDVISYREITAAVYGDQHPYGYNSQPSLYEEVTTTDVNTHYKRTINARNCKLFVAGDTSDKDHVKITWLTNQFPSGGEDMSSLIMPSYEMTPTRKQHKGNPTQTSIKLGQRTFDRNHEDYNRVHFSTTLLGGYFGSRLVSRIREELGLTYGIYASVDPQLFDGSLIIATEVANENVEQCLNEIYHEMERLKTEKVTPEELALVKNYLMGNYLNLFDGPFNSMKAIKSIVLSGIPLSNLNTLIASSVSVSAEQVQETAQQYFNRNDFWEMIVGSSK